MRIVLVEFGIEDREAEAYATVEGARAYFVDELEYLTEEQFNRLVISGVVNDVTMYKDYLLGD